VAMFARHGWRRTEMALAIAPAAAGHMRRLVRMAQLTLSRLAETRLIVASIHPANTAGLRMAALTGFRRARMKTARLWVFRRQADGETFGRRRQRGRAAGGRAAAAAAADRQ